MFPTKVELNIVSKHPTILQMDASHNHNCVLFDNKKIKCWGNNIEGQLGSGHTNNIGDNESIWSQDFVDVGANILQISLGNFHTCVLLENKNVKCWGDGRNYGALGPNYRRIFSNPSSITPLSFGFPIRQVVSGSYFNCVLGENGRVKCWGDNTSGKLGYGHTDHIGDSPLENLASIPFLKLGTKVKKLALGYHHACALLVDGNIKCWGNNRYGQLGLGHTNNIGDDELPSSIGIVSLGQRALDISAGDHYNCALLENKNIKCWGNNKYGQLGLAHRHSIGDNELVSLTSTLDFSDDVKKIFTGSTHICALFVNNKAKCWGSNEYGKLSYIHVPDSPLAAVSKFVGFDKSVYQMALGLSHTCAVLRDNEVRCFGRNNYGNLGLGHTRTIGDNEFISEKNSSASSDVKNAVIAQFDYSTLKNGSSIRLHLTQVLASHLAPLRAINGALEIIVFLI